MSLRFLSHNSSRGHGEKLRTNSLTVLVLYKSATGSCSKHELNFKNTLKTQKVASSAHGYL